MVQANIISMRLLMVCLVQFLKVQAQMSSGKWYTYNGINYTSARPQERYGMGNTIGLRTIFTSGFVAFTDASENY